MKILMVLTSHDQLGETGHKTGFYVGGHGPMWDLAESPVSIALLESFYNSGKPIALVCHSPGVLSHAKYQGVPLVKGKHVAGFTNGEEEEMQLTKADWQPFSVVDGLLVTGQNPASSTSSALTLLESLTVKKAAKAIVNTPGQDNGNNILAVYYYRNS